MKYVTVREKIPAPPQRGRQVSVTRGTNIYTVTFKN